MKLIGLTGGIASGKSMVTDIIRGQGMAVIDADILAREVVTPGSFGLRALVEVFGPEILSGNHLNRTALGEKIFSDPACRLVVERITHPLIQWRAQQEIKILMGQGEKIVFYDAALIFEKDLTGMFDAVVVVNASTEAQIARLSNRDKISKEAAAKRLESQWPLDKKAAAATYVIDNSGTQTETKKRVLEFLRNVQSR